MSDVVSVDPQRWRPTRAGLVNVWQYTDEVLEFERGRMVLYGPNGSGKTMALELLLPHLLDAKAQPARLSTSGADRGGLWERVTGYDAGEARTAFLWLEFSQASGQTFTLGVRLRAKPSGGGDKQWFTTHRRIGIDVSLLDEHRRPLTTDRLDEVLGEGGRNWRQDTAGYRHAVRSTLFPGWSEQRLDALVRTLLVVRKQNVSDGLSSAKLSSLLSEALPPLDDQELGRVADGFADLDRRRDHIAGLQDEVAATQRLVDAHRAYARTVVAKGVADVISATTALDNVARDVRKLSDELHAHIAEIEQLADQDRQLEAEDRSLYGRLEGLRGSEAYRHGAELSNLRQAAEDAKTLAEEAHTQAEMIRQRASERRDTADRARAAHAQAVGEAKRTRAQLEASAGALGAPLSANLASAALVSIVQGWIDDRRRAIQKIREHLQRLEVASTLLERAKQVKTECDRILSEAEQELDALERAAVGAQERWWTAVSAWRSDAHELGPHLLDTVLDDPETARSLVLEARSIARDPLVSRQADGKRACAELERTLEELREELAQWKAGRDPEPEPPAGRRDRTGLAGAPVWRLLQFREEVSDPLRARIESALLDCGLLDAWVDPEGTVRLGVDDADVMATLVSPGLPPPGTRSLRTVLEPDPAASAVPASVVERLLATIALVDADAHRVPCPAGGLAIGEDGTWRTPRLAGRAIQGSAQYIGASSRASFRRAKIAELEADIERRAAELRQARAGLAEFARRIQCCDQEARGFPSTKEIEDARRKVDRSQGRVESARGALQRAVEDLRHADRDVTKAEGALRRVAGQHELPTDPSTLTGIAKRLDTIGAKAGELEKRTKASEDLDRTARREEQAASEADGDASEAERRAERRGHDRDHAVSKYRAVEEAVGADYRDVLDQIDQITSAQASIREHKKALQSKQTDAARDRGRVESALSEAQRRRQAAEAERSDSHEVYVSMCRDGLVREASVGEAPAADELASVTAVLESARRIKATNKLPTDYGDARLTRLSNRVMERVGEASRQLAGRVDLQFEPEERQWAVLRARKEGMLTSARALLDGLRDDLQAAETELSRKQQELFEQILSGSVREHLKERLWAAQALVDRINGLLGGIQTAAGGVKVQLQWEIDPEQAEAAELRRAKALLLRDSPVAQGRTELDAFLRARIEQVRADDRDIGEWRDRLARMLDYRAWHRFRVLVHHRRFGDRPRALDSRKVSLSAGEKTIVMVLPLLAAVTAHYEPASGDPPCSSPRLLLMDELFPKLDFPNKRQLMALLPTLDLDAMFTSDKDRCEYDTLDGVAIVVFQKLDDDKTTTTRLVWNGRETMVTTPESAQGTT